jgi:GNAT superfamily N-acetyltransferase
VDVRIEPATPDRWDDVVSVFGTRGDPSRCWCTYLFGDRVDYADRAGNQQRLRERVAAGSEPGVLAYPAGGPAGGEPVGWAAVTPREEMLTRLTRSPRLEVVPGEGVWSVECFVVPVQHRRQGVATALLAGAVEHARARGGRALEGHPREDRDGRRWPGAVAYQGLASMFAAAGFTEVARRGDRPVFRLDL